MFLRYFIFSLLIRLTASTCENLDSAYNKNEIVSKIESCKEAIDQFDCVDEFSVKPANLLLNFGLSIGFIERYGIRLNISSSAHEFYQNCTRSLLDEMPDYFAIEVQKLMNSQYYDGKCLKRAQICSLNKAYLYPFICLARHRCSLYLTDAYFALITANQQLSLETNEQLKCLDFGDQDLRAELYTKGYVFERGNVLSTHFCRGISIPPRRVIREINTASTFKITIGLEYFWP